MRGGVFPHVQRTQQAGGLWREFKACKSKETPYHPPETEPHPPPRAPPPAPPSATEALERVDALNPELATLEHLLTSRERGVRLARKKGRPDFTVGAGYTRRSEMGGEDFLMTIVGRNRPTGRGRVKAGVEGARPNERAPRGWCIWA